MTVTKTIKPKEDLNDQIVKAARNLFQTYGLHKVTMDDIGKKIGKHRSSLYYYYKSKEEVFNAVKDIEMAEVTTEVTDKVAECATIEDKLRVFCEMILAIDQKKLLGYTMSDIDIDTVELSAYALIKQSIHLRYLEKENSLLYQMIDNAIRDRQLPSTSLPASKNLIFLLSSSLHGIRRHMIIENNFEAIPELSRTLSEMFIRQLKS